MVTKEYAKKNTYHDDINNNDNKLLKYFDIIYDDCHIIMQDLCILKNYGFKTNNFRKQLWVKTYTILVKKKSFI